MHRYVCQKDISNVNREDEPEWERDYIRETWQESMQVENAEVKEIERKGQIRRIFVTILAVWETKDPVFILLYVT